VINPFAAEGIVFFMSSSIVNSMTTANEPTPRERFIGRLNGDGDRVPVFLRDLTLGLDALNMPTDCVFGRTYNAKASADCVLALQQMIGQDAVVGSIHTYGLDAFGGRTKYPRDGIPYLDDPPFADISKMDLHSPDDIRDETLTGMRESYRIVRSARPDLAVVMNVGGVVNTAGNLRGVEMFMMDVLENPDIAHRLVEFGRDIMLSIIGFIGAEHCDTVYLASASDNPDMLGPEDFVKYSLEGTRKVVDYVHSLGKTVVYHPHGLFSTSDRANILKASIDTGTDGFQFAEGNEPSGIIKQTRGRCAILGGVDSYTTLLLGPDKRIVRDTDRFLSELGNEDYILTCSCSLNRGIPISNVKVMVDEVRRYNREGKL
jgi:uroporphyrinogen-III decarboxylase